MNKKQKPGTILRVIQELRSSKGTLLVLVLLAVIVAVANISVPLIAQKLIDRLIDFLKGPGGFPLQFLYLAAAGILVATVVSQVAKSIYNYNLFLMVTRLEDKLRFRAYENYLLLHASFHHSVSSGQIIGRIDRGATGVYVILNDVIGQYVLPPLIIFLGVIAVLLWKNPLMAVVVFLPLPIYVALVRKLSERIYDIEARANEQFENAAREEYDVAGNVLTVKKFSRETAEIERQQILRNEARTTQYLGERAWAVIESLQTAVATIGRVAVIALSGYLVIRGTATIGEFVFFVTLQDMAYHPLSQLSVAFPRARRNASRAERLFRIIDEPRSIIDKKGAKPLPPLKREVRFQNVSFRYFEDAPLVLKNINVAIPAKSVAAVVGRTGSGKTTFINLLLRAYDPQEGAILIDGHDLRDVTQESLRSQIAVVPQEVDLFSRTIGQNIAYGRPQASQKEISGAAKLALAHDFIMAAPQGYDTMVGERGLKLSGGERQRVGIARAVLKQPKILILDEATSHLDTESERLVQSATEALMKNTTTIIIAHRLSTVLRADMILVFDQGRIVAAGKHRELLESSPVYRHLYEMQFRDE